MPVLSGHLEALTLNISFAVIHRPCFIYRSFYNRENILVRSEIGPYKTILRNPSVGTVARTVLIPLPTAYLYPSVYRTQVYPYIGNRTAENNFRWISFIISNRYLQVNFLYATDNNLPLPILDNHSSIEIGSSRQPEYPVIRLDL